MTLQSDRTTPFSYSSSLSEQAAKVCATVRKTQQTQTGSVWVSGMTSQSAAIAHINQQMVGSPTWDAGIANAGSIGTAFNFPITFNGYTNTALVCVVFGK
jgi:hypothetical protein